METLDLHGVRHHEVEVLVEAFVLLNETPLKIITGHSPVMKNIVSQVLDRHSLRSELESDWNLGAIVVYDN